MLFTALTFFFTFLYSLRFCFFVIFRSSPCLLTARYGK